MVYGGGGGKDALEQVGVVPLVTSPYASVVKPVIERGMPL